jgi:hypothetical protein
MMFVVDVVVVVFVVPLSFVVAEKEMCQRGGAEPHFCAANPVTFDS